MKIALITAFLCLIGQIYSQSDSLYSRAAEMLHSDSRDSFFQMVVHYKLQGNHIFQIPAESQPTTSSSSSYSRPSRSGLGGLFAAFAQLIAAPFVALDKALKSIGNSSGNSSYSGSYTPPKMVQTNLVAEMLRTKSFGQQGEWYHHFAAQKISMDSIDRLDAEIKNKSFLNLWHVAAVESDTEKLRYLIQRKSFPIDSSFVGYALPNAFFLAIARQDHQLFRFCINQNSSLNSTVSIFVHNKYYLSTDWYETMEKQNYYRWTRLSQLSCLDICENREMKKELKLRGALTYRQILKAKNQKAD